MRRLLTIVAAIAASAICAAAQTGPQVKDSVVYRQAAALDSSLVGRSIFDIMPSRAKGGTDISVRQTDAVSEAMRSYISSNPSRIISGYRVRIFFDNAQNARGASEEVLKRFLSRWHGIPAYRSYQNPFFKVTVGDFRTKSEALELLEQIKREFPAAFILKENINYPVIDKTHSYDIDTVRVILREEI